MSPTPYPQSIKNIPYATTSRLQTLDICLPRPLEESPKDAVWVIYIHGGAWRDPRVTSAAIEPALTQLLTPQSPSPQLPHIAGFASLSYRLSPHPAYPGPGPSAPAADRDHEGRNVTHPTHVRDVAAAMRWLRKEYGVGNAGAGRREWVAIGHSCGATLAFQLLGGHLRQDEQGRELPADERVRAPIAVVGLEGIYDLPLLVSNHSDISAYRDFTIGAFGPNEKVWAEASPAKMRTFGKEAWPEGRLVVVGQSPEDELVEREQADVMIEALEGQGVGEVAFLEMQGRHDDTWKEGKGLTRAVEVVVGKLFEQVG